MPISQCLHSSNLYPHSPCTPEWATHCLFFLWLHRGNGASHLLPPKLLPPCPWLSAYEEVSGEVGSATIPSALRKLSCELCFLSLISSFQLAFKCAEISPICKITSLMHIPLAPVSALWLLDSHISWNIVSLPPSLPPPTFTLHTNATPLLPPIPQCWVPWGSLISPLLTPHPHSRWPWHCCVFSYHQYRSLTSRSRSPAHISIIGSRSAQTSLLVIPKALQTNAPEPASFLCLLAGNSASRCQATQCRKLNEAGHLWYLSLLHPTHSSPTSPPPYIKSITSLVHLSS